jgi:hypothetical protein
MTAGHMKIVMMMVFLSLVSQISMAHPVIWKHGVVASTKMTSSIKEIKTHYSLKPTWALGVHGIAFDDVSYGMVQSNFLLKRWNGDASQGNMYLFSGVGLSLRRQQSIMAHLGAQADWETRHIYTYLSVDRYVDTVPIDLMTFRLGVSPYLVGYDGLSTWLILHMDHQRRGPVNNTRMMPVLRFFKDTILFELGSDFSNRYLMTLMIHF